MDRLTLAELARIRAEHIDDGRGYCAAELSRYYVVRFPCSTARLIHDFAPGPVPHLAGVAMGLFGPLTTEELAR